jgi:hypothetical protein
MYTTFSTYFGSYYFDLESSAGFGITAKKTMLIYMYADWDGTTDTVPNTTDFMDIAAVNNRLWLNSNNVQDFAYSTVQGTFIGDAVSRVFLDKYDDPLWQVLSAWDVDLNVNERLPYYYVHNQKYIAAPSTSWTVATTVNTRLTSSTTVMASTLATRIVNLTTSAVTHEVQSAITSIDLTQFHDGTAMTSDDFLVVSAYVSSTAAVSSTGKKVYVQLGASSDANYEYRTTGLDLTTGWNLLYRKFTPDATEGVPALNNITWVRCGWQGVINSTSAYVAIDYIGVVRQNPDNALKPSVFTRLYNGVETAEMSDPEVSLIISNAGTPNILMTPTVEGTYDYRLYIKNLVQFFRAKVSFQSANTPSAPSINLYLTDDRWFDLKLSSGVLRLNGSFDGTTYGDYANVPSFSQFVNAEIELSRTYGVLTASFRLTTAPETYREITLIGAEPTGKWNWGSIYIGGHSDKSFRISNISIKKFGYRSGTDEVYNP